ncbi:uncharacterized protein [Palaemon carinicauda]|uniref:uncharacterized protein isoform X1 n=1 Tax=Palaemon carinicauda TaxID=392227 RepID=UPI0035B58D2D
MDNIEDEAIIEAVKLHKAIYDRSKNTNRKAIDVLWKRIAEELGGDEAFIRKRWSCLRDYFLFQHKILLGKKTGKYARRKKKWPLYDKMSFLIPQLKLKEDTQAVNSIEQSTKQPEEECKYLSNVFNPSERSNNKSEPVRIESCRDHTEASNFKEQTVPAKFHKIDFRSQGSSVSYKDHTNLDDDTHFIMSLLPLMRTLNPLTRLEFRIEVQSLLLRCQKRALSGSTDESPKKITVWSSQQ